MLFSEAQEVEAFTAALQKRKSLALRVCNLYCEVIVINHSGSIKLLPLLAFAAVDVGSFVELNHVRFLA